LHEIDALRTGLTQATKKDSSIRKQILQRNGEMHVNFILLISFKIMLIQ